ncbi:hypothetical protein EV191_103247 [Tamaricihabitans halophyticus]|uniref:Uncharacterized protein n=1 Tax=Tamaricihabitans halophyticus TaxID=1262583 RepID=A0A4R2QXV9_9PSEU|nr:hypothetical protein [Tamaricihabitans halophyticus]TCP54204.1 hypothetical protein EV191_103247 [Tamaricihabitans halophyticus]
MRRAAPRLLSVAALGVLLVGCSEVTETVDQVENAGDKASACTKALGIVDLNPNIDPQQAAEQAGTKATELRELAEQTANTEVQQTLNTMAESYATLDQRAGEQLSNFDSWLQQSLANLENLRKACT